MTVFIASCSPNPPIQTDPVMQRYSEVSADIARIVEEDGAIAGLDYLKVEVERDPSLADVCHGLSHEVGQAALKRYGFEDALQFEKDVCGSGYIHGVVETYLAEVPDLDAALLTLCAPDAAKCFHGVGHGLMDRSKNDIPGSLQQCDRFAERFQQIQCAEGVFMENFEADPASHPSAYLKLDDPFFACRGRTKVYEGVCALYAPRAFLRGHPRDYAAALAWCETSVPEGPRDGCIKGVGEAAMKQNIQKPLFAESVCDGAVPERQRFCIEGLTSYYIVHHASHTKGLELCAILKPENQASCQKIALESARVYPE